MQRVHQIAHPRPAALDSLVLPVPPPLPPSEAALDEVAEILARAKRPMIWLGNGARNAREGAIALVGLGASLWASGSQVCIGASPALVP